MFEIKAVRILLLYFLLFSILPSNLSIPCSDKEFFTVRLRGECTKLYKYPISIMNDLAGHDHIVGSEEGRGAKLALG